MTSTLSPKERFSQFSPYFHRVPANPLVVPGFGNVNDQFHFFIIFDDVVEYLSIRCTQLKKQGRRT